MAHSSRVATVLKWCFLLASAPVFAAEVQFLRHEFGASSKPVPAVPVVIPTSFNNTAGIALQPSGDFALVADIGNNRIHQLDLVTGAVTLLAGSGSYDCFDSNSTASSFRKPLGIAIAEDFVLVADEGNNKIRRFDFATGAVSTVAGDGSEGCVDGIGEAASFNKPSGIALHLGQKGAYALVADKGSNRIRKIDIATGEVTTLAGTGNKGAGDAYDGASASFNEPRGIAISLEGTFALVADTGNSGIRIITMSTGEVITLAGSDVNGGTSLKEPTGIAVSPDSSYALVADRSKHMIYKVNVSTGAVSILAGNGTNDFAPATGETASFLDPVDIAIDSEGVYALVADGTNSEIRKVFLSTGEVTTMTGEVISPGPVSEVAVASGTAAAIAFVAKHSVAMAPDGSQHCTDC